MTGHFLDVQGVQYREKTQNQLTLAGRVFSGHGRARYYNTRRAGELYAYTRRYYRTGHLSCRALPSRLMETPIQLRGHCPQRGTRGGDTVHSPRVTGSLWHGPRSKCAFQNTEREQRA
jgi:hypothetical protein